MEVTMPEHGKRPNPQTPPAMDPTAIGPPPTGAKVGPDGKVTSEVTGTKESPDKAKG